MADSHMRNENMQYNPNLWSNRRNFRVFKEVGVEEHDGDVRFWIGSRNMAISCMRNEKYTLLLQFSLISAIHADFCIRFYVGPEC